MNNKSMYNLTSPQKSIWLTEKYFEKTPINNICGSVIIKTEIDLDLLNTAINYFIKNNDCYQLRFCVEAGEPMQYFCDTKDFNFEVLNIKNESEIEPIAQKMVNTPFQILNSKLFDFKLFKLESGFGGFIVNIHHIISDAAGLSIIGSEVIDIYSKLLKNESIPIKTYSYVDFINSEKDYLKSSRFNKDKEYWKNILNPLPESATFAPQKSDNTDNYKSKRREFILNSNILTKIKNYCFENKISVYNFLVGIYSIYIGRINNTDEFLIRNSCIKQNQFLRKTYIRYVY